MKTAKTVTVTHPWGKSKTYSLPLSEEDAKDFIGTCWYQTAQNVPTYKEEYKAFKIMVQELALDAAVVILAMVPEEYTLRGGLYAMFVALHVLRDAETVQEAIVNDLRRSHLRRTDRTPKQQEEEDYRATEVLLRMYDLLGQSVNAKMVRGEVIGG